MKPVNYGDNNSRCGADGQRLYELLALFDNRDGTPMAHLVRSAREGWERSHPDMAEDTAWEEFDTRWANRGDLQAMISRDDEIRDLLEAMADSLRAVLMVTTDDTKPYPWRGGELRRQIREDLMAYGRWITP